MKRRALVLSPALCAFATPLAAQTMAGMDMPGMNMPASESTKPKAPSKRLPANPPAKPMAKRKPTARASVPADPASAIGMNHAAHSAATAGEQSAMPGMDHGAMAGMDMSDMAAGPPSMMEQPSGTDQPSGLAAAPVIPADHYADRFFATRDMDRARSAMMREGGGQTVHQLLFNLAEIEAHQGRNGYRWDGEAFLGGDIDRLWLKSEGEGTFRHRVDGAEVQALVSHAISPYYDLQAGVRQDIRPRSGRTYATIGFEGLAPYMFETEGALFVSGRGDLLGRLEAWYDQRITTRLVLQPRAELNFSAQDVPEDRYGVGLVDAELGLRLRYEIERGFAPYVGLSWERKAGRSADYARAEGERPGQASFVAGMRTWF